MTEFDVDIEGDLTLREALQDEVDSLEGAGSWVVGTAVEYAIYLEFGTRKMDPKPFIRPAVREAQADLEAFVASNTGTTLQQIDDADDLVRVTALALERRVKDIIKQKGLIDTGTLRASIRAVPINDRGSLPSAEEVDPDAAQADIEVET